MKKLSHELVTKLQKFWNSPNSFGNWCLDIVFLLFYITCTRSGSLPSVFLYNMQNGDTHAVVSPFFAQPVLRENSQIIQILQKISAVCLFKDGCAFLIGQRDTVRLEQAAHRRTRILCQLHEFIRLDAIV